MSNEERLKQATAEFNAKTTSYGIIRELIIFDHVTPCNKSKSTLKKLMEMPCQLKLNDLGELCAHSDDGEITVFLR